MEWNGNNGNYLEKEDINSLTLIKMYFLINSSNTEKWYTLLMNINILNAEIKILSAVFVYNYMLDQK